MDEDEGNDDEKAAVTHRRKRKIKAATTTIEDFGEEVEKTKKSRRRKTLEEDKVFDIPPIENFLSTTFKGRLGYACLNTMLRKYSTPIFCSRTCRLATIAENGPEHLRTLGLQNIRDLLKLVTWNAQNGIFFMRMSSEMFPFASHPEHGYDLSFADEDLKAVGKTAKELGVRLTSHPGQFTQLGSPREVVVRNAVRDLEYHCEMMDRMGLDQDSVMIIHMGGTFGDEAATLERFKENYTKLLSDSIKRRLVLENDELCYNVDDLLPLCRSLNIPLVFDYHHDWIYPSSRPPRELIPEINQLWYNKGIRPKQHYSEPRPGAVSVMERRAHSDRVKTLPEGLPDDMDLMLECKDKEQAVFYLYRLYNLREVDPRMLRPPAEVESLHTNGRKSTKRARAKAAAKAEAAAAAIETGKGGEADGEDMKMNLEEEVEREAEEHGVPAEETKDAVAEAIGEGELDCGSGDEMPKIEVLPKKVKKRRGKRTTRVETNGNTGQKASRRKGKNVLKQDIV
ncbi:UV-endonuclease UvdE [Fomitiporia mediterranea MF3/22]|uniref:UV-endonuclease UvdE n=1 Tax=Fomitiporia mediterranea (strain MF3/22) TaxID=694068 RepID=UPI000440742A|nr:UV-endonuclease UvdE [Fomitiporia mediterranea MF3/22]EJC98618.1 UV-endonuclease UvdE [Fomitiporia mediterranea MF3/22]